MDGFKESFSRFLTQVREFWTGLNTLRRVALLGTVLLVVAGVVGLIAMRPTTTYGYVFKDLSPEDSAAITTFLQQENIEYTVDQVGIKIPSERVTEMQLKLTQEGLPNSGVIGWEKFDNQDFTRTEADTRINQLRAIQGELQRTITMIEGVKSARVHIVTPRRSLFIEDQKEPTAAIYLKTQRGAELEKKQIRGMQHLVSRAVEGLTPKNVTILDQEGTMLTEVESDDMATQMTKEMLAYKRAIEGKYEDNVRAMLARIVGPERVDVKVDAEVDFTQEQQTISDVDPDRFAVTSRETEGYSLEGTGLNPTGIPGSKSNVPGDTEDAATVAGNSTENTKDRETINYEVTKTVSQRTLPIGTIRKLSAAVIVDGKQEYATATSTPDFEPRTEAEMAQIQQIVQRAIGFNETRGDQVTVQNIMFQLDPIQKEAITEEINSSRSAWAQSLMAIFGTVAVIAFFAVPVRRYFHWLSYDPDRKKKQQLVEEFKPDLELGGLQNVQIKEDVPFEKLSPQEQVLYLAKNEPKRTTEAIRLMLNPHQSIS